eukprot:SAG31_NODE_13671_length_854_cov_1.003974_2_plen_91_part_01
MDRVAELRNGLMKTDQSTQYMVFAAATRMAGFAGFCRVLHGQKWGGMSVGYKCLACLAGYNKCTHAYFEGKSCFRHNRCVQLYNTDRSLSF